MNTAVSDRSNAFSRGLRDVLPIAIGLCAWGFVLSAAMLRGGLAEPQALAMSLAVYAGGAQIAVLPFIRDGLSIWVALLAGIVVNLRFIAYSLALRAPLRESRSRIRLAFGYFAIDVPTAVFLARLAEQPNLAHRDAYFVGVCVATWICFQSGALFGLFATAWVPDSVNVEIAGTLCLLAIIVPACRNLPTLIGCIAAAIVVCFAHALPLNLGLLVAVVAGGLVAALVEDLYSNAELP